MNATDADLKVFKRTEFDFVLELVRPGYQVAYLVADSNTDRALLEADYGRLVRAHLLDQAAIRIAEGSADDVSARVSEIRRHYPGVMTLQEPHREQTQGIDILVQDKEPPADWEHRLALAACIQGLESREDQTAHSDVLSRAREAVGRSDWKLRFTHTSTGSALSQAGNPLTELLLEMKSLVEQTPQYDAGAYRFHKTLEVLEAERTASRRDRLYDVHREVVGDEALYERDWRSLWPQRKLFVQDFESEGDWTGQLQERESGGRCLQGATDNRWFGRFMRVGINYDHARAATRTWIRFRYLLSHPAAIQVMLFDLSQKDNYRYRIESPEVGAWTTVELDVTAFTRADGTDAKMAAGDAIDDVFFCAGKPGDESVDLLIDDVVILGRD